MDKRQRKMKVLITKIKKLRLKMNLMMKKREKNRQIIVPTRKK